MQPRKAQIKRDTGETKIRLSLNIDGRGKSKIDTGIPFLDHMLTLFAKHATMDLNLRCNGDVEVDDHHTVEDCGIALGQAFTGALGDKKGVRRYGTGFDPRNPFTGEAYVPMDECLARCVVVRAPAAGSAPADDELCNRELANAGARHTRRRHRLVRPHHETHGAPRRQPRAARAGHAAERSCVQHSVLRASWHRKP